MKVFKIRRRKKTQKNHHSFTYNQIESEKVSGSEIIVLCDSDSVVAHLVPKLVGREGKNT